MARFLFLLPALLATGPVAAEVTHFNLSRPGALDELQQADPARYEKVAAIVRAVESGSCESRAIRLMKARHELRMMACGSLYLTSFPAKRDISFVLDDVHYTGRITMAYSPGRVMKAQDSR